MSWKGISLEVLVEAGVEVLTDEEGVALAYRNVEGERLFSKRVRLDGRSWYEPSPGTGGLVPFGLDLLPEQPDRADYLFVTEGESDCLAVRDRLRVESRRIFAIGMPGANCWRSDWSIYLEPFSGVFIAGDGDEPGRRFAWSVKADCPWARVLRIPDGEDLRSLLQAAGGEEELKRLMREATWDLQAAIGLKVCSTLDTYEAFMRRQML